MDEAIERLRKRDIYKELKKLIDRKVVAIEPFDNGAFDSGYIIIFDNGMKLTAQDGEYGDNALNFIE